MRGIVMADVQLAVDTTECLEVCEEIQRLYEALTESDVYIPDKLEQRLEHLLATQGENFALLDWTYSGWPLRLMAGYELIDILEELRALSH